MTSVTPAELKHAIEARDARALTGFYADDAVMRIVDRDHPPSAPLELKGKGEIATFYEDICGREMTHHVDAAIADDRRLAFTLDCAYPDGARVVCTAMADLDHGLITRQTQVQAWDG